MSESSKYTRDTETWHGGGDIVLVAENTAFRVHRSLVARQSDLLERILDYFLSVPQVTGRSRRKKVKAESRETFDGVPVVPMVVAPYDLGQFLKVVYDGHVRNPHLRPSLI